MYVPSYSFKELYRVEMMAFKDGPQSTYQGKKRYCDQRFNVFLNVN